MVTFKTFQSVNPPEYHGDQDPVKANAWLKEMEKAFVLVNLGENQKVEFASYFLKGESNYWWETVRALEPEGVIAWNRFKEVFLEKNFPRCVQNQMEIKFLELKQGGMSVIEYEKKFTELARFVGDYVNSDEKRARRFQQGLRPWLRSNVGTFELRTYAEVVQKALVIEGESEQIQKEKNEKKRKFNSEEGDSGRKEQDSKQRTGFQARGIAAGNFKKKEFGKTVSSRSKWTAQLAIFSA